MIYEEIARRFRRDKDLPDRCYDIQMRLRLLNGTFYDKQPYTFEKLSTNGADYIELLQRKPNITAGTNELRGQTSRQVSMCFGENSFPEITTTDADARATLKAWIAEAEIAIKAHEMAYIGSTGSVALHLRVLAPPAGPSRIFLEVRSTEYLTPEFDPFRPDTVIRMTEKYKVKGRDLDPSYSIAEDDLKADFWFQRIWDDQAETWFIPWLVSVEADAKAQNKPFTPKVDPARTIVHRLGFADWIWIAAPGLGQGIDGPCSFQPGVDIAIALDYLESALAAAMLYNASPTLVIQTPATPAVPGDTPGTPGAAPFVKSPSTILTIDSTGKAYYLETDAAGLSAGRAMADAERKQIIEGIAGDRVDPREITQGHQGSKSLERLNGPLLAVAQKLRSVYGNALLKLFKMVLRIIGLRDVLINDEIAPKAISKVRDLGLRWGAFYSMAADEKVSEAQALTVLTTNGVMSNRTATEVMAPWYGIQSATDETAIIAEEHAQDIAEAQAVAAKVQATQPLTPA